MKKICHDIVSTFTTNYIHKTFITNGPSWVRKTWSWLTEHISGLSSGDTLVDVVAKVFSGISTAINAVKNVANAALNAVKSGLEFISNAVLALIYASISAGINAFITAMFYLFANLLNGLNYDSSKSNPALSLNNLQFELGLDSFSQGLQLNINDYSMKIYNPLLNPRIETLGLDGFFGISQQQSETLKQLLIIEMLIFPILLASRVLYNNPSPQAQAGATGLIIASQLAQGAGEMGLLSSKLNGYSNNINDFKAIVELLSIFHLAAAVGLLAWFDHGIIMDLGKVFQSNYKVASRPISNLVIGVLLSAFGLIYSQTTYSGPSALFNPQGLQAKLPSVMAAILLGFLFGMSQGMMFKKLGSTNTNNAADHVEVGRDPAPDKSDWFLLELIGNGITYYVDALKDMEQKAIFAIKSSIVYHLSFAILLGFYWNTVV